MSAEFFSKLLVGILPVLCFLASLVYLDSYKLVRLRSILIAILAGCVAAGASFLVNVLALSDLEISKPVLIRYVAPVVEELFKGFILVWLVRSRRVGFLVDAAIFGFAVGAGFALVENLYYLDAMPGARWAVWIVRGFGTAIMHGGTTAILGIISRTLTEERGSPALLLFVPGFLSAIVLHSFFNHFFFSPVLSAGAVVLVLPPLLILVYRRSETTMERWLGVGFDANAELLRLINSGELSNSNIGRYLQSLRNRFRPQVLADMLCYLRLHVELALRAKGLLMLRESGFETPPDTDLRATLDELNFLERSIGKTGRLAVLPLVHPGERDLWQLHLLGGS